MRLGLLILAGLLVVAVIASRVLDGVEVDRDRKLRMVTVSSSETAFGFVGLSEDFDSDSIPDLIFEEVFGVGINVRATLKYQGFESDHLRERMIVRSSVTGRVLKSWETPDRWATFLAKGGEPLSCIHRKNRRGANVPDSCLSAACFFEPSTVAADGTPIIGMSAEYGGWKSELGMAGVPEMDRLHYGVGVAEASRGSTIMRCRAWVHPGKKGQLHLQTWLDGSVPLTIPFDLDLGHRVFQHSGGVCGLWHVGVSTLDLVPIPDRDGDATEDWLVVMEMHGHAGQAVVSCQISGRDGTLLRRSS